MPYTQKDKDKLNKEKQTIYGQLEVALSLKKGTLNEHFKFEKYDYILYTKKIRPILEKWKIEGLTTGEKLGEILPNVYAQVFQDTVKKKGPYTPKKVTKEVPKEENIIKNFLDGEIGDALKGIYNNPGKIFRDTQEVIDESIEQLNKELMATSIDVQKLLSQYAPKGVLKLGNFIIKTLDDPRHAPVVKLQMELYSEFIKQGYDITSSYQANLERDPEIKVTREAGEAATKIVTGLELYYQKLLHSENNINKQSKIKGQPYDEIQYYRDCAYLVYSQAPEIASDPRVFGNTLVTYLNSFIEWVGYKLGVKPEDCMRFSVTPKDEMKESVKALDSFKGTFFDMHTNKANQIATQEEREQRKLKK